MRGLRPASLIACAIACISAGSLQAESTWSFLRPKKGTTPLRINIAGEERTYYALDIEHPIEFTADGPGDIKIISRLISPTIAQTRSYILRVTRGAGEKEVFRKEVLIENGGSSQSQSGVGEGEESVFHIPRGRWECRLYLMESDGNVAVRLLQEERAPMLVPCIPDAFERVVILVQPTGNEYPHYHFTAARPLVFRARGPAQISIRSRLDFTSGGLAVAPYALECIATPIGGAGETVRETAHFWTPRLEKAYYRDCPSLLPGESMPFDFSLPTGDWSCEVRPADGTVLGVSARVLMPKAALIGAEGS